MSPILSFMIPQDTFEVGQINYFIKRILIINEKITLTGGVLWLHVLNEFRTIEWSNIEQNLYHLTNDRQQFRL